MLYAYSITVEPSEKVQPGRKTERVRIGRYERPAPVQITLKNDKLTEYFPKSYSAQQMEEVIFSLLETWKNTTHIKGGVTMGVLGVKTTECDYGLDMLDGDVISFMQKSDFRFNVKEVLTKSIIDEIRYSNRDCPEKLMEYFIQGDFPYRYDIAVLLIAECLTDYFSSGELILDIYERNNAPYQRKVSEFI